MIVNGAERNHKTVREYSLGSFSIHGRLHSLWVVQSDVNLVITEDHGESHPKYVINRLDDVPERIR
jgi:hypothetical protein